MRIVVIGGGISGLAAAFLARAAGHDVTCLEPNARPGGLIGSVREDGFLFETGPQAVLDDAPDTVALIDAVGLGARRLAALPAAARRFIYAGGALHAVPSGPGGLITSKLLPFTAKLRLLREPFVGKTSAGPEDDSETVLSFGTRRLGPEAARVLLATAVIGIYAGDAAELSMASAFPRLAAFEREHGSLLAGLKASRRAGRRRGHPLSFPDGLGELPRALTAALGPHLVTARAGAVTPLAGGGWRVDTDGASPVALEAEAVVVAADAPTTARLLGALVPEARALVDVATAPAAICALGFHDVTARPLGMDTDAYGFLVARHEAPRMLGCQYESSTFAARAPEGSILLRGILGGVGEGFDPGVVERTDERIARDTLADLRTITGLAREPDVVRVWRHPVGIPQYRPGHRRLVAALDDGLRRHRGLYVLGHAVRGTGVNECIRAAASLSRQLAR
ncbi:MAG TPA: protoporphyrinogen oxidase [Polyangia bacterium]|nr:protoporphyrinogen oxidase [Polyangia bacterium]